MFAPSKPLKQHICIFCGLQTISRSGIKKHYITQHASRLDYASDVPVALKPHELVGELERIRAGQKHHRVGHMLPSSSPGPVDVAGGGLPTATPDSELLDTATGGRPATPPAPRAALPALREALPVPTHVFAPVTTVTSQWQRETMGLPGAYPVGSRQAPKADKSALSAWTGGYSTHVRGSGPVGTSRPYYNPRVINPRIIVAPPQPPNCPVPHISMGSRLRSLSPSQMPSAPYIDVTMSQKPDNEELAQPVQPAKPAQQPVQPAQLPAQPAPKPAQPAPKSALHTPYPWDYELIRATIQDFPDGSATHIFQKYVEYYGKRSYPQMERIKELIKTAFLCQRHRD